MTQRRAEGNTVSQHEHHTLTVFSCLPCCGSSMPRSRTAASLLLAVLCTLLLASDVQGVTYTDIAADVTMSGRTSSSQYFRYTHALAAQAVQLQTDLSFYFLVKHFLIDRLSTVGQHNTNVTYLKLINKYPQAF